MRKALTGKSLSNFMMANSSLKILIVSNAYPSEEKKYSGIFVKNQYEELLKNKGKGDIIELFYMSRKMTSFYGSIFKYIKTVIKFIPFYFRKYDIIHLHFFYPLIMLVYIYKVFHPKSKLIVTFHGSDINLHINKNNKLFFRYLAKKVDYTIPVGIEVSNNVKNKLDLEIGKVLPVGIDESVFYHVPDKKKCYDLLFVGSFLEVKGIDKLYELIKLLDSNIKICIVGKGSKYESKFKELIIKGHNNISLKIDQTQNQLRELYNESKFLILPSRSEGFPTVTLEAMYCGTPVLTSNIPQFKEQVEEGTNGYTFSINDISELKEFVLDKLNTPEIKYKHMVNGALNSHKEYSLSNICNKLLKIYRS